MNPSVLSLNDPRLGEVVNPHLLGSIAGISSDHHRKRLAGGIASLVVSIASGGVGSLPVSDEFPRSLAASGHSSFFSGSQLLIPCDAQGVPASFTGADEVVFAYSDMEALAAHLYGTAGAGYWQGARPVAGVLVVNFEQTIAWAQSTAAWLLVLNPVGPWSASIEPGCRLGGSKAAKPLADAELVTPGSRAEWREGMRRLLAPREGGMALAGQEGFASLLTGSSTRSMFTSEERGILSAPAARCGPLMAGLAHWGAAEEAYRTVDPQAVVEMTGEVRKTLESAGTNANFAVLRLGEAGEYARCLEAASLYAAIRTRMQPVIEHYQHSSILAVQWPEPEVYRDETAHSVAVARAARALAARQH